MKDRSVSKFKDLDLKGYTVCYRNLDNIREENCFYALDAFEARSLAMKFNEYIKNHPNSIDMIRCESSFKKIFNDY